MSVVSNTDSVPSGVAPVPVYPSAPPKGGLEDTEFGAPVHSGDLDTMEAWSRSPSEQAFEQVATQEGIWLYRHRRNKLRVCLVPLPANRVCTLSIVFTVGSKSEVTGMTGSAHILEHELFKTFDGFDIWKTLGDRGAVINASTSKDRTEFHCTIPSELIYKALELEALRMERSPLTGLKTERIVVRNEFERGKCEPSQLLREEVYRVALGESSTIGSMADIENIINHADKLRAFFKKFYCCANAAIVISGTFDPEKVLQCVDAKFGHLPAGESTREGNGTDVIEPVLPQRGIRSVDVAGQMPIGTLSFRVTDGVTREGVALEMVSMWFSEGPSGPFGELLKCDPELHGVEADFCRVHGVSLFTVWLMPVTGGDCTARVERLQQTVLGMLIKKPCLGLTEDKLRNLKQTLARAWQTQINSTASYTQAVVESFSRCNTPFDVVQRVHVLQGITLADVRDAWRKVFVLHRLTIGRVLPELMKHELCDPTFTKYTPNGDAPKDIQKAREKNIPFDQVVVTGSGAYMKDPRSSDVCLRVHVPSHGDSNAEASLRASLAMLGVKLQSGEVLDENQLMLEFSKRGARASVTGTHAGLDVVLNVRADEDVGRLVDLLRAGIHSPSVTQGEYTRKKQYLSELAVGSDYNVTACARRLFSQCVFHDPKDPRRLLSGLDTSRAITDMRLCKDVETLGALGRKAAWVTCVAPTNAHLRAVREAFEREEIAEHDTKLQCPCKSPYAGRVVTHPMQGKTSATMILGCACPVGPASEHATPLSLALDALGGGFKSRLMSIIREREGLTYGENSSSNLSDPSTTVVYVIGTFAPSLLERGVRLTKQLVSRWRKDGITAEELETAKSRAIGSARVAWDTPSNLANSLHASRLHFQTPAARCKSLPERIQAVTLQDCNNALGALPPFEDWVCVCAGGIPATHTL